MLTYVAIGAGIVAIVKIFFSSRGRIKVPGVSIGWG